ncbi:aminotransferase class V-fold PLP-dependent enzyme [Candidatus Micrarchaeota archaeon]|nr:aminotransferase class V-fold PLP-dependent enzyme [Candidatus Micrarchaeota archaeon]
MAKQKPSNASFNVEKIRADFPILKRRFGKNKLAYLDNAASAQKPQAVIDALADFYANHYSNVHRSVSTLAMEATDAFESARETVAQHVGAQTEEIVFTRNTSESINLVAYAWGNANVKAGDAIVITEMDHHSNLVPWQQLALLKKAELHYIPVEDAGEQNGQLDADFEFPENTKLFAFPHVSNVLGTVNDIKGWSQKAKFEAPGTTVVVDGAAGAPHFQLDLPASGADFYAFSGHKMCGPMGSGVLWGKKEILQEMPPFLFGGSMISKVEKEKTTWADLPAKFEAGTPNAADAVGLAAAINYLNKIGLKKIHDHEIKLADYACEELAKINGVTLYGPNGNASYATGKNGKDHVAKKPNVEKAQNRVGIVAFNLDGVHAHDLGSILDQDAIAIRSGHHCAQALMERLNVAATARASFYLYNTQEEVDRLVQGVKRVKKIFS